MDTSILTGSNRRLRELLRRGAVSLDSEAQRRITDFVYRQFNPDGGVRGRGAGSDLYYTVFGLECASVLNLDWPAETKAYLEREAEREQDFVHATCLLRSLELAWPEYASDHPERHQNLKLRIGAHACKNGGFHGKLGRLRGSIYDTFLGMLACESLAMAFPGPDKTISLLDNLQRSGGGFVNQRRWEASTTPVTAAAVGIYWELSQRAPENSLQWLLARGSKQGGFVAAPLVPLPDLLSTATALHALRHFYSVPSEMIDGCLDFVTGLWDESGGFTGHALDGTPDCEYTFYALLTLGNLAPEPLP